MHHPAADLVIVANRLPVQRVAQADGRVHWETSPGGLVTALTPIADHTSCTWVGWAGNHTHDEEHAPPNTHSNFVLEELTLTEYDVAGYYSGFANQTLWPLLHSLPEYAREEPEWERAYQRVNETFAQTTAEIVAPGGHVWVHDYHLLLVPKLLRALRPDVTVSFFLHIPVPDKRVLEPFPRVRELLGDLWYANLVGVQTPEDAARLRDMVADTDIVARPVTIDAEEFEALAATRSLRTRASVLRQRTLPDGGKLLLSVDRLDYTKGIIERLNAYAELLEAHHYRGGPPIQLVQILTPTRDTITHYRQLRTRVEELTAEINGRFGTTWPAPVVNQFVSLSRDELLPWYLAADVLCVTPLRDGMNLVAKEFAATRVDERGVLVLSTTAGAARELTDAVTVTPNDRVSLVEGLRTALDLPEAEATARMRGLRRAVHAGSVTEWAEPFLTPPR